jgi:1-acyl-sn-glycerol-3-phosphate acyltransferase
MTWIGILLHSLVARTFLIVLIIVFLIPLLFCLMLPKRLLIDNPIFAWLTRFFYWFCIKGSMLDITYKGRENIPDEPVIIVANHQSSFDIPLIGYALGKRHHIWLALSQLVEWLSLRFVLPRVAVLVDTSTPIKGLRTLLQAINLLKEHTWDVIIFPEGGRFTDGLVHDFYAGFATIAQKTGRPVVPIRIFGINKVYPPDAWLIHYYPVTVVIGKPFVMQPDETDQAFKDRMYQWFVDVKE